MTVVAPANGWIKVCGITSVEDAEVAVVAGASAIGLNLWPKSPRSVPMAVARDLATYLRGRVQVVVVTVNLDLAALRHVQETIAPDFVQLHGDEPDAWIDALAPAAYRALGLATADDVGRAAACPGPWVLVDARDPVRFGGTGTAPPPSLAQAVCRARRTVLAGGLGADNVAAAIHHARPWGVDAASRLEHAPGKKDARLVQEFVDTARRAFAARAGEPDV